MFFTYVIGFKRSSILCGGKKTWPYWTWYLITCLVLYCWFIFLLVISSVDFIVMWPWSFSHVCLMTIDSVVGCQMYEEILLKSMAFKVIGTDISVVFLVLDSKYPFLKQNVILFYDFYKPSSSVAVLSAEYQSILKSSPDISISFSWGAKDFKWKGESRSIYIMIRG